MTYRHGSPADRGSADRYYGRPRDPHWYPHGTYNGICIRRDKMTKAQIKAYNDAYDNETDRKVWD